MDSSQLSIQPQIRLRDGRLISTIRDAIALLREHESRPGVDDRDEVLPNHLEADQLAAETSRPVPRAALSRRTIAGLWALRVFVVIVSVMVIYVFVSQLGQ